MQGAGVGEIVERLRSRRGEIEAALRARVYAIADPGDTSDPAYSDGLRLALSAALEYGLTTLDSSEEHPPPVPVELIAQARLAARNGVGIDTVLRRYFGGYVLLGEFLAQEAAAADVSAATLKRLMRAQAVAFDRLLTAVSEEHGREAGPSPASAEHHRLRLVQRLLSGEPADATQLAYDLEGSHLAMVASGARADSTLRGVAEGLEGRLLLTRPDERTCWAWLGARSLPDPAEAVARARSLLAPGEALSVGEPGDGLAGWRLSHRQATAALAVAIRGSKAAVRYADVALLASALQDDLLTTSLRCIYLDPLEAQGNRGEMAKETLRAYFIAGRNISSAAAAMGLSRPTVRSRLRTVETRIRRNLGECAVKLDLALQLDELVDSGGETR